MHDQSRNDANSPDTTAVRTDGNDVSVEGSTTGMAGEDTVVETRKPKNAAKGIASLAADDFSIMDSMGGIRGIVESILPGLIFIVAFVSTGQLGMTVALSLAEAVIQLVARLFQRQSIMGALSGLAAVVLCLVWAWLTKDARNYYLPGFLTNAVWIVALSVSMLIRIPGIGACIEFVRKPTLSGFGAWLARWREDGALFRAYMKVTGLWILLFAARLVVQVPMYLTDRIAWLGTARLIMGVPCFALVIWLSWLLVADPLHRHAEMEKRSDITDSSTIGD
ncbi:MAG: DUF3159 domain-containing protein [Bifidobacterium sp.]